MSFSKIFKQILSSKKGKESSASPVESMPFEENKDSLKTTTSMEDYEELDTELQWDFLEDALAPLKEKYQGRFIRKNEEEELALNLSFKDRATRIQVDVYNPEAEVFMKFENKTGTLRLYFDPDYEEDEGVDDWSDNEQKVHFISDGIYFEEYPEDFEVMKSLADKLPDNYRAELTEAVKALNIHYFKIDAALIEADVDTYIPDLKDIPGHFEKVFAVMKKTADLFSTGEENIEKLASVYIQGVAVKAGKQFVTCNYCDSTVIIGSDAKCPNCGGTIKP